MHIILFRALLPNCRLCAPSHTSPPPTIIPSPAMHPIPHDPVFYRQTYRVPLRFLQTSHNSTKYPKTSNPSRTTYILFYSSPSRLLYDIRCNRHPSRTGCPNVPRSPDGPGSPRSPFEPVGPAFPEGPGDPALP